MKVVKLFFLIIAIGFSSIFNSIAQDRLISGKITVFDSIPLIGANVKVKSTKQEVLTDTIGNFLVGIADKDVLIISAHGFYNQRAKLQPMVKFAAINLKLKSNPKSKELAIGYGYISDKDKLDALSRLNTDDIDFSQYNSVTDIIRSRFPGVEVNSDGSIVMRGVQTINSSSEALIVVDGKIFDSDILNDISTSEIKSIDVLKGVSATVYGVRGANGVVLIETKTGGD